MAVNGSDQKGDGSRRHPWKTISYADSTLSLGREGTVVHVMPGAYTFLSFTTRKSGTATARITWRSEVKWGAKLTYSGWVVAGSYTDVDGFEVGPDPAANGGWGGIQIGGNYVHVTSNYVHNKGDDQISCPDAGAIYINATAHDALVDSNVIYSTGHRGGCQHSWGYGTGNHGIYVAGYHNMVTNNLVSKAAGWGIHFDHNPCQNAIANNTVFYNFTGGIYIGSTPDGIAPCAATGDDYVSVTNNLAVHNGWGCSIGNRHGLDGILFSAGIGAHDKAYNNLMAGNLNTGCSQSNSIVNLSTQPIAQGGNINGGSSYTSLFANYHDEYTGNPADYQLSSTSAARDAGAGSSSTVCAVSPGVSPCVPTTDFNGTPRPNGRAPDIGAYEY